MPKAKDEMQRWLSDLQGRMEEKDWLCFPTSMTIYAPTYAPDGTSCMSAVMALKKKIDVVAGGSTMSDGTGTGFEKGKLKTEPVKVIKAAHCLDAEGAKGIGEAIMKYAVECDQETISVSDSKFFIIPSETYKDWYVEEEKKKRKP